MGMNVGGNKGGITPNVNVTPLVDVTLVVLIIFMVVTPLMTKTFWLNLPKQDESREPLPKPREQSQPLVMTIDKDGVIRINKTVLHPAEVETRLPRMLAASKQKVLYFDAHDELPYGRAVAALDSARAGGARSIAMLTEKVAR